MKSVYCIPEVNLPVIKHADRYVGSDPVPTDGTLSMIAMSLSRVIREWGWSSSYAVGCIHIA